MGRARRRARDMNAADQGGRPSPETVIMLRALGLGDFLTGVPAYRAIREAFPTARTVLAAPADLAGLAPLTGAIDELLPAGELEPIPWQGPPPLVAIDLHGRGPASHDLVAALRPGRLIAFGGPHGGGYQGPVWREGEHEVARWCRLCAESGIPADPADLVLAPSTPDQHSSGRGSARPGSARPGGARPGSARADSVRGDRSGQDRSGQDRSGRDSAGRDSAGRDSAGRREASRDRAGGGECGEAPVIIHPGAGAGSRRWPAERFAAVAACLDQDGGRVLITGSDEERDLARRVAALAGLPPASLVCGLPLAGLASLVADSCLVISGDTGISHLAFACERPSVTLYGPTSPAEWGPPGHARHQVLWPAEPGYRGDPHGPDVDPILAAIGAAAVLAAARRALDAGASPDEPVVKNCCYSSPY